MKNALKHIQINKPMVNKKRKEIFIKKEKENNKTMYHTKIMKDLHKLGIDTKKNQCRISFQELYYQTAFQELRLYPVKEGDKFLGIFYGYRKPIKNFLVKYEVNGIKKAYTFSKTYYIEFRFRKGSVFCYLRGLFRLLKKEKINTQYNKSLVDRFINLEKHVYEFYNKKHLGEGFIIKWILKNLK
ncbi:DUF226 domain-containing protein (plasmid) [Borrelia sp. CA_690]|uniref:DUF226 domain-containing protein n=1 Tax=Borrelia maritima TaxID=2761123 RepID=A0A5J6WBS0_9SPIR|nr:DUF226 domain-containing protein [Borrelia maritima]QFI15030.1 DUF226 domain-containing protein [Borrelia maritima]